MKKIFFYILIAISGFPVFAQLKIDSIGLSRLNGGLKALSLDNDLVHASWGFCLLDPKTGKIISEYWIPKPERLFQNMILKKV